jgi:hypothetical protein
MDLKKAKREGFLPASVEIVFRSTEAIPSPPAGFRVMFLAFLLRGFSLPTHEFLRGLLFEYGVQLHQLAPYLLRLRPTDSQGEILEHGGAIVSVRLESQYLDFKMPQSVQGWRHKWFYIMDQKSAKSDKYGFAPFDANKSLKKLTTSDALPSDAKVKNIKPLLAHIQELKNAIGKELTGTQLMVFFL